MSHAVLHVFFLLSSPVCHRKILYRSPEPLQKACSPLEVLKAHATPSDHRLQFNNKPQQGVNIRTTHGVTVPLIFHSDFLIRCEQQFWSRLQLAAYGACVTPSSPIVSVGFPPVHLPQTGTHYSFPDSLPWTTVNVPGFLIK